MWKQILSKLPNKKSSKNDHRSRDQQQQHTGQSSSNPSSKASDNGAAKSKNSHTKNTPSTIKSTTSESNPKGSGNATSSSNVFTSFEALPSFKDVPNTEKPNLLMKKLNLCCVVFDFSDPTKNIKEKEIKKQTLLEIVEYMFSANLKFSETVLQEVIRMVSVNIFRTLNPQPRENKVIDALEVEEEEPSMDPSWPHLQPVYEILLRLIASPETDTKLAKKYIDQGFVIRLLDLFDSEDQRERDCLKTILHRVYGKFMVHRPFIRKSINNIFFRFIFETEKHNGIAEFLEILGSIINGFALPLKEEHKAFLVRALIPLHKPKCLQSYHQQLSYCITQFVEKDCKLADTVIRGFLRYWPVTSSTKEVLFLNELEEVLEATQPPEFQRCMVPLFRRIARCLNSLHFQVAERALFLWNNDHIENLIMQNRRVILPIIFPALERNAQKHWSQAVHSLTLNVKKIFNDQDPDLVKECVAKFKEFESKEDEIKAKREETWRKLEEIGMQKQKK